MITPNFKYEWGPELPSLQAHTNTAGRRYQTPEGKVYPSVTTVLQLHEPEKLLEWRQRVGEEEADRITSLAAAKGSAVHELAENYLRGDPKWGTNATAIGLDLFEPIRSALEQHITTIRYIEVPLYSDYLRIAGRTDLIGYWDDVLSIIDFKTANKHKPRQWCKRYFMQEAAYALAHEERTGVPIEQLVTVISPDDNNDVDIYIEHRDDHLKDFIALRKQYEKQK